MKRSRVSTHLAALVFSALNVAAHGADPGSGPAVPPASAPRVERVSQAGKAAWSLSLADDPAPDGAAALLTAAPWHKRLPDLEVRLLGGGAVRLQDLDGTVVLLDFWATWCGPCQRSLPRLQSLYETHRDAGLVALAINVGESPETALPWAEDMGLTMPIGVFQDAMRPTLYGNAVPTLVVADRQGNIRGRWDGFEEVYEAEIVHLVDRLVVEDAEPHGAVARLLRGAGTLRLEWYRELAGVVEDLAVARDGSGKSGIVVSHARLMAFHLPDGQTDRQWAGDREAGRIRLAPTGAMPFRCASFRPGGRSIVVLAGEGGAKSAIPLPSHVFDVAWMPPTDGHEDGRLLVGTLEGLYAVEPGGGTPEVVGGFGTVSAIALGEAGEVVVLESAGRLHWLDPALAPRASAETAPDRWGAVALGGDALAAPGGVAAMARGRFMARGGEQLALATGARLRVVSLDTGETVFEAEWPGITALAAGDLDGDGGDELVVGQGKFLALLTAPD